MLPFSWYMLKVMICSGILFGYYWLFLRNKIFNHYNRFYLLVSVMLSLLLPFLKINFWQPDTAQNQAIRVLRVVSFGDEYISNVVINKSWRPEQFYLLLYYLISLIFLSVLLRTIFLIRTLLKKYPVQQIGEVVFVNTQHNSTPFSFLKYIFWNSHIDMDTTTGRQIFKHELAHVQEKHTHDKLFVNIVLIFCWCNPFFWLYRKELNMIHEFIADKKAVEDSDTAAFAAMILQAAYPKHQFQLTNNFFYSPIKRRLLMLSKNKNPKANYIGRIMVLPLMVLVFAAFSLKAKNDKISDNHVNPDSNKPIAVKILTATPSPLAKQQLVLNADTVPERIITGINPKAGVPLYVVNGNETDKATALDFKPEEIETVRVIKDEVAIKIYGEKGKNGVVIINLKTGYGLPNKKLSADTVSMHASGTNPLGNNPLIIVDNIEYPGKTLSDISAITGLKKIEHIDVYGAQEGMKIYSEKAKEGAIVITTKQAQSDDSNTGTNDLTDPNEKAKIYIGNKAGGAIDLNYLKEQKEIGVTNGYNFVSASLYFSVTPFEKVVRVDLNSNSLSTAEKYINQCTDGTVLIFDKLYLKDNNGKIFEVKNPPGFRVLEGNDYYKVFTQVEQNPEFTGGVEAWRKFLREHLKASTPVDNGAKAGIYKVVLKFIVNADGSLSDIKCETDPGFGTGAEAIRFIKTTPKWQPAVQNGKKVSAYFKQPITFAVEE